MSIDPNLPYAVEQRAASISQQGKVAAGFLQSLMAQEDDMDQFFLSLMTIKSAANSQTQPPHSPKKKKHAKTRQPLPQDDPAVGFFSGYQIRYLGGDDYPVYEARPMEDTPKQTTGFIFRLQPAQRANATEDALADLEKDQVLSCVSKIYATINNPLGQIECIERADQNLAQVLDRWHPLIGEDKRKQKKLSKHQKEELINWLDQSYDILLKLYKQGIVFTDIKPGNLFSINDQIVFSDIKSLRQLPLTSIPPTTERYTAPEVAHRTHKNLSTYNAFHSSLYALAVTGCELLTGSRDLTRLQKHRNTKNSQGQALLQRILAWSDKTPEKRCKNFAHNAKPPTDQKESITPVQIARLLLDKANHPFWADQGNPEGIRALQAFFQSEAYKTTDQPWKATYQAIINLVDKARIDKTPTREHTRPWGLFHQKKPHDLPSFQLYKAIKYLSQGNTRKANRAIASVKKAMDIFNISFNHMLAQQAQTLTAKGKQHADKIPKATCPSILNNAKEDALAYYDTALKLHPLAETYAERADIYMLFGNIKAAIKDCQAAMRLDSGHTQAQDLYHTCLMLKEESSVGSCVLG